MSSSSSVVEESVVAKSGSSSKWLTVGADGSDLVDSVVDSPVLSVAAAVADRWWTLMGGGVNWLDGKWVAVVVVEVSDC